MKSFFTRSTMLLGVTLMSSVPSLWAGSLSVYVGYADNLRPSGFFPSTWLGSSGVVSQSPVNQSFDSGAIRIDNTGSTAITISNFQVYFPSNGSTFALWAPLTIGAGQIGIFAQNNYNNGQFDTSDFGVFGAYPPSNLDPNNASGNGNTNLIGGCSSAASFMSASQLATCTATVPVITFLDNGVSMSFSDTGHILDTGEYDFVNNNAFGEDGNESINWNAIGGSSRGGTTPEPANLALLGGGLIFSAGLLRRLKKRK